MSEPRRTRRPIAPDRATSCRVSISGLLSWPPGSPTRTLPRTGTSSRSWRGGTGTAPRASAYPRVLPE